MIRAALTLLAAGFSAVAWHASTYPDGRAAEILSSVRAAGGALSARASAPAAPVQRAPAPIPVATSRAVTKAVPIVRASTGWIEPAARVTVRARMDGAIVERHVREGATVREGELLFRLDDREIRAQIARAEATLSRARAVLAKAEAEARRSQELLSRGSGTQAQAEEAAADVRIAAADLAASEAALRIETEKLARTRITAPMTGRVGVVSANEGDLVRGSDPSGSGLVTITRMHPLTVSFPLPERDLGLLRAAIENGGRGSGVRVALGEDGAVAAEAELTFIDSAVDTRSGTILAKATLRAEESFWPGQYVRVQVTLGTRPEAVAVPLVALQPGQDGSHVFVVRPDSTVMRRRVESVETRGDEALIGQGLASGERVVVEGQSGLRDGSAVVERVAAASALPQATAEAGRIRR